LKKRKKKPSIKKIPTERDVGEKEDGDKIEKISSTQRIPYFIFIK